MTLPERRRITPAEHARHDADADAFFARPVTEELRERVRAEAGTPKVLLERWKRDCERARTDSRIVTEVLAAQLTAQARARARERAEKEAVAHARADAYRERERARKRKWMAQNPEKMAAQRERWKEQNQDRIRASGRAYYHRNKEELLEKAKRRREDDPATRAEQQRRYYQAHQDRLIQRARKYRQRPEVKERRRAYNREWARRERRRVAAGLPPRRLHRVPAAERDANQTAADVFFTQPVTAERKEAVRAEGHTPPEPIAAWERENERIRTADGFSPLALKLAGRRADAAERRAAREAAREAAAEARRDALLDRIAAQWDEEDRLDRIARAVNTRLRASPAPRTWHHNDPAAYDPVPDPPGRSASGPSL